MNAIHIQQLNENLIQAVDQVCNNHEAMIITRDQGEQAVLISYEEYSALAETAYLLRSPAMASRLHDSLNSFEQKNGVERQLIEDE